jgi:sulfite exporter TauE/SafE
MGFRTLSGRGFHLQLPGFMNRLSRYLWTRLRLSHLPPWLNAALAGTLTVFLPCGHLYGFLVGAMATGTWWAGAGFMAAFWIGTLPALAFGAAWIRSALTPWLEKAPRLAGLILILAGLAGVATFASRVNDTIQTHSHIDCK